MDAKQESLEQQVESTSLIMRAFTAQPSSVPAESSVLSKDGVIKSVLETWFLNVNSEYAFLESVCYSPETESYLAYGINHQINRIAVYFIQNLWEIIERRYPTLNEQAMDEIDQESELVLPHKEIGHAEVDSRYEGDETKWLHHIAVNARYQKRGIGTKLIELAKNHLDLERFPYGGADQNPDDFYLTEEGAALLSSCARKGIIDVLSSEDEGDEFESSFTMR